MSNYEVKNTVGSPRLHFLNLLTEKGVYSEFEKEGFTFVGNDQRGYYFTSELLEKDFDLAACTHGVLQGDFMKVTGYSRPKINSMIETHGRVVYLHVGYYDLVEMKEFLKDFMQIYIERRGRPSKK